MLARMQQMLELGQEVGQLLSSEVETLGVCGPQLVESGDGHVQGSSLLQQSHNACNTRTRTHTYTHAHTHTHTHTHTHVPQPAPTQAKQTYTAHVIGYNQGGLILWVAGFGQAFMPLSCIALRAKGRAVMRITWDSKVRRSPCGLHSRPCTRAHTRTRTCTSTRTRRPCVVRVG